MAFRARDASPDSVIFTLESNFFSSASASVDRCSFTSDARDRDSFASELSMHLVTHDGDQEESSYGPDLDSNKAIISRKCEKAKVAKQDNQVTAVEDNNNFQTFDSARNSFSLALKECQERRSRSEANLDRQRPSSLDLNNVSDSSPRLGSIKKSSIPTHRSGTFLSPGTPNYRYSSVGMQKGWSSERVPLRTSYNRRQAGAVMLPFNPGRTLPSKWEDAERWIFSPVAGNGIANQPVHDSQRRPKSKSGPLGPAGVAYHSMYSPAMRMFEVGNAGNSVAGSPFSAGVLAADRLAISSASHGLAFSTQIEPCMGRSISMHECSEMLQAKGTNGKIDGLKDAATDVSRTASRRDMATQMSPDSSTHSSPRFRPSFSVATPSALQILEVQSVNPFKSEVRDVEVDERVTVTRWSKNQRPRTPGKNSDMANDRGKKNTDSQTSSWDISETDKRISKVKRNEAKITAWENLQNAKAEAAILKLEMKLEKKRSSSMGKIMTKLRRAQKRAQQMRSSVLAYQGQNLSRSSRKVMPCCRSGQISSLSGCFTWHAF